MLEQWPAGGVLLVDTYELLSPLDEWLRDTLLPQLPARSLVVIAGRHEPGTAWRTNVDWAGLTRIQPLGNFDPDESRAYLTRCGLPAEQHGEALTFTRVQATAAVRRVSVISRHPETGKARRFIPLEKGRPQCYRRSLGARADAA